MEAENVEKNRADTDREAWKHNKYGGRRKSMGARKRKRMEAK